MIKVLLNRKVCTFKQIDLKFSCSSIYYLIFCLGDVRLFQKERAVLLEQLEECPSSGDESIVSPRKRIKIDHHSIISSSGLVCVQN